VQIGRPVLLDGTIDIREPAGTKRLLGPPPSSRPLNHKTREFYAGVLTLSVFVTVCEHCVSLLTIHLYGGVVSVLIFVVLLRIIVETIFYISFFFKQYI